MKDDHKMKQLRTAEMICLTVVLLTLTAPLSSLAAGPVFWDWPSDRPFSDLEFSGAALNQDGQLVAGLTARPVGPTGPEIFWRVAADGQGGFYTGTGHGGEVHHTNAAGESRLLVSLSCTEIFSLLPLPDGDLLVGCGPEGHLYRVQDTGESRIVGTVAGGYVWQMILDEKSNHVWVATGSPAGLSRLDLSSEELKNVLELPAKNTMAVHAAQIGRAHV